MKSGSIQKYDTMDLQDIKELPVEKIASKNSVLFLWATTPLLPEAFEVMSAWGYQYKTAIYWRKIMSLGMGFWFRGQVELCLLGVRGKVKAFRCQKCNFIQSKVRKHSQKPNEFFDLINPVVPCPKIELFAREQKNGWESWGNEIVSKKEIEEALRQPATRQRHKF
jgi:N6-adenosine-specific RNA methylase IME4